MSQPSQDNWTQDNWTHWGLNPWSSACVADVIPLHHAPFDEFHCDEMCKHIAIHIHSRKGANDNKQPFVSCVDASIQASPSPRHRCPDKCCAGFRFRHPTPRSSGPDKFCGCLFLRSFPLRKSPPLAAKARINDARVFCFRPPPQNEGPEQHKRVFLIPESPSSAKQWPGHTHTHTYIHIYLYIYITSSVKP